MENGRDRRASHGFDDPGVGVADLTRFVSSAYASLMPAMSGAEVSKIESPTLSEWIDIEPMGVGIAALADTIRRYDRKGV